MSNRSQKPARPLTWTAGTLLLFAGLYLLLYVGGVYADEAATREAARGDSAIELPPEAFIENVAASDPQAFVVPDLARVAPSADTPAAAAPGSTITRIAIPSIAVDSKVIEVGWTVEEGVATWQVAKFAVGHHQGSANPGGNENIVMAGHVGGAGPVFAELINVEAGDQVVLYSEGQQYLYVVKETLRLQEVGVSDEERQANAKVMEPTGAEMVTLITCWPPTGPNAFDQRIVVRAEPFKAPALVEGSGPSNWTVR